MAKWTPGEEIGECCICRREGGAGVWLLVLVLLVLLVLVVVGMGTAVVEEVVSLGGFVLGFSTSLLRVEIRTTYLFRRMGEGGPEEEEEEEEEEERESFGFGRENWRWVTEEGPLLK